MTPQQAAIAVIKAVHETIREMGSMGAPSGVLYAGLMSKGCNINQYNSIIDILKKQGKIREEYDVLYAVTQ